MEKFKLIVESIKKLFHNNEIIPLHEPFFNGNEKKYLNECIDSTFVSSVGEFVTSFENKISNYTKTNHGTAVVNGTSALSVALKAVVWIIMMRLLLKRLLQQQMLFITILLILSLLMLMLIQWAYLRFHYWNFYPITQK